MTIGIVGSDMAMGIDGNDTTAGDTGGSIAALGINHNTVPTADSLGSTSSVLTIVVKNLSIIAPNMSK